MYNAEQLLKYLKEDTKENHDQAELNNLAKHIIDHSITTEQYCKLISHNYHIYKYLEVLLMEHKHLLSVELQEMLNFDKSESLYKDINLCGENISEESYKIIKNPDKMDLIGAMYVMEGSMLGGLLLANHIKHCPNLKNYDTFHFFTKDAKESTRRWKSFGEALNNGQYTGDQIRQAVLTAKKVFSLFYQTIN